MDGHRKVISLLESQQIYKPYINTMYKNLGQEKISIYLPGIYLLYFLVWTNHTNYCVLELHRNKMVRDSTFTCSLKSTSSYHFRCIFLYFSMTTSTYCFSKKDNIRQMGQQQNCSDARVQVKMSFEKSTRDRPLMHITRLNPFFVIQSSLCINDTQA